MKCYLCHVKACCLPKWAFHTGVGCATRLSSIVSVGTAPGSFAETNRAGRNFFSQNETAGLSAENPSERRNGGGYMKNSLHKTNNLASGLTQKLDWIPPFFGRGISNVHICVCVSQQGPKGPILTAINPVISVSRLSKATSRKGRGARHV